MNKDNCYAWVNFFTLWEEIDGSSELLFILEIKIISFSAH